LKFVPKDYEYSDIFKRVSRSQQRT